MGAANRLTNGSQINPTGTVAGAAGKSTAADASWECVKKIRLASKIRLFGLKLDSTGECDGG